VDNELDYEGYKRDVREMWSELGDYRHLAELVYPIAEVLCEATGIGPGTRVLDLATGTGNVAIEAARRGAAATAVDITPRMIQETQARATAEGLSIAVLEADVEHLPLPAASFDCVLSACGAWWAPRPDALVRQMARVLVGGGRLGLAGFTAESFLGRVEDLIKQRLPLAAGIPERNEWAAPHIARDRLGGLFDSVDVQLHALTWTFASGEETARFLFRYSASHVAALSRVGGADGDDLIAEVAALAAAMSVRAGSVELPVDYAVVTATAR
jgi:ubiquinone/menaquinone biosynthesis C-methylase UbiE